MKKNIDNILLNWADWRLRRESDALGYPKKVFYCELVHIRSDFDGFVSPVVDDSAFETDRVIARMQQDAPKLAQVIFLHYTTGHTIERKLGEMACSRQTYYNRLARAQRQIADALGSKRPVLA